MRIGHAIAAVLLAAVMGGCAWINQHVPKLKMDWPWKKKEVPVTSPEHEDWSIPGYDEPQPGAKTKPAPATTKPAPAPQYVLPIAKPTVKPPSPKPARAAVAGPPKPVRGETKVVTASALQVNDEYIGVDEVLRRTRNRLRELPENISENTFKIKAAREINDMLRGMITERLVLAEARKNLADPMKKQIDAEVQQAIQDMITEVGKGSRTRLEHALEADGTDLKSVEADHRREMTVQTYLRWRFMPAVKVNQPMLLDYFKRHQSDFAVDKKVQMQIIFAPVKSFLAGGAGRPSAEELKAARERAKELIEKAAASLARGDDFGEVAKKFSRGSKARQGGLWPLMPAGSFRYAEVEKAAFALEAGAVSEIIATDAGYFIVKAAKIAPGKIARFEEAQEEISDILTQQQYRKLTEEYFQKLLAKATIGDAGAFIRRAVDEAVSRYYTPGGPRKP